MKNQAIIEKLRKLKSELNFKYIQPHELPTIDLGKPASNENQELISKFFDYTIQEGDVEALNFIQKKTREHLINSQDKSLDGFLQVINQTDEKEWFEEKVSNSLQYIIDEINQNNDLEKTFIQAFQDIEDALTWDKDVHNEIFTAFEQIGNILEIPILCLNSLPTNKNIKDIIKQLDELKIDDKFVSWFDDHIQHYPNFYIGMNRILNNSIDQIKAQLKSDPKIDQILFIMENAFDEFWEWEADNFSYGDTVERDSVNYYYKEIMKIIGIQSSRGLLEAKYWSF